MSPNGRMKFLVLGGIPWLMLCLWIGLRWHDLAPLIVPN